MNPQHRLDMIRRSRVRPERDLTIGRFVQTAATAATRTNRQLGDVIEQWRNVVPEHLAEQVTISSFRGGVLHVEADSAAVRYELDRFIRTGGLSQLRQAVRSTLHRVRVGQRAGRIK